MRTIPLLRAILLVTACSSGDSDGETTRPVRNVVTKLLRPELIEVKLKLPVLTRPRHVIELRTSYAGTITEFNFEEGQDVPASPLPSTVDDLKEIVPVARINDAELREGLVEAQLRFQRAERVLKRVQDYADSTIEELDAATTARDIAGARVRRVHQTIRSTYVCSPEVGVLTRRLRRKGEVVGVNELIGVVSVLDPIVCEIYVPEAHISSVHNEQIIEVVFESIEDPKTRSPLRRSARITLVDRVAHAATHTFRVQAEIVNTDGEIPAGIFGTTYLTVYSNPRALLIPLSALVLKGGGGGGELKKAVFVEQKEVVSRRVVTLGRFSGDMVEVIRGLKQGEHVVTVGGASLSDGDRVTVRDGLLDELERQ